MNLLKELEYIKTTYPEKWKRAIESAKKKYRNIDIMKELEKEERQSISRSERSYRESVMFLERARLYLFKKKIGGGK